MKLKVALGADHGGFTLKNELVTRLQETYEISDLGACTFDPNDDYPDFALAVAGAVASGQANRGILICGSGVGACIAANKVLGVRACLCHDTYSAHQGVEHDDMNILCLGSRVIGIELRGTKAMNAIQEALQQGQAIWFDYIRRGLLKSGEFQELIEQGISGVTSNPTIFEKAIVGSTDYDEAILALAKTSKGTGSIYEALAIEDIRTAADLLRTIYNQSSGLHGYVSLEVNPALAHDTDGTIKEANRLFAALDRPNVMIKVPATPEGIPAIRSLIGEGININVTLIFSLDMYRQVMEAYIAGIGDLVKQGRNASNVASVASFFLSRIDTVVDALLEERLRQGQEQLRDLLGKAAVANAKLAIVTSCM
jgi:transaldolase/glucose-6-phosphate isomerase